MHMCKKLLQVTLYLALFVCEAIRLPIYAVDQSVFERYNCGRLGIVSLRSSKQITLTASHSISSAQINIPSRNVKQLGVVHAVMGGNDRTFTRNGSDNYRSIDETNPSNPIMMRLRSGSFLYGKKREEIIVSLQKESYTCIPL